MTWLTEHAAAPSLEHQQQAQARQLLLTKPPGSLGELETIAATLAGMQATDKPNCERVSITIFASDHGVAAEGVSAFPQSVTAQMVKNFSNGGAAISVLAKSINASLQVINVGTVTELPELANVLDKRIAAGTANFTKKAAMSAQQLQQALKIGQNAVREAKDSGAQVWIGGEMGIGNSTSATALACAYLKLPPASLVGPGAGLDNAGQIHKSSIIHQALELFSATSQSPLKDLQYLGGFEIAALTGAYITAAQLGLPVLVDGFICSVAALYAQAINPSIKPWLLLSHTSAEPGHTRILNAFAPQPILNLGMCLGEASGAAASIPLIRLACDLHNNMATFTEAGVSEKSND